MRSRHPRSPTLLVFVSMITLLVMMFTPLQPWLATQPASAQIDNNQPTLPYASVVNCLRTGADQGRNSDYSPRFAVTCFGSAWDKNTYEDPVLGSYDSAYTDASVYTFGDGKPDAPGEPGHQVIASLGTNGSSGGGIGLGAVYGLAYDSGGNPASPFAGREHLFASAFAKRITRFGPGGPGAIYLLDRVTDSETLFVQIPHVVPGPTGAPGEPGTGTSPNFINGSSVATYSPQMGGLHTIQHDDSMIYWAGRVGLGDLEIDAQNRYLYVVNLQERNVYRVDTWSANPQSTVTPLPWHPIQADPTSCNVSGASGPQDVRIFGLKATSTSLFVGFACTAETSQDRRDLGAGVLRYDLATQAWQPTPVMTLFLPDYDAQRSAPNWSPVWQPWWNQATYPPVNTFVQPLAQGIISSIDFDEQNNMIVGIHDRLGEMSGGPALGTQAGRSFGDLLLAPWNGTGWDAPSSALPERYNDYDPTLHNEMTWGAATYVPGQHNGSYGGEIATTFMTPYDLNTGGAAWYDGSGGNTTAREELYDYADNPSRFGKTNGLGDLEILCDWRAIGDRIWNDVNGNGIQDAGETDINGVLLNLRDTNGSVVAQVTTGTASGMSGNYRFYVEPFTTYTVEIDPSNYAPGKPLYNLGLTVADAGADTIDSDANSAGQIGIPTGGKGDLTMTFDAGLAQGANVRITKSAPAQVTVGQTFSYTLAYFNDGPSSAQNVTVSDTLPTELTYVSANPPPSSQSGQSLTWNAGTLAPNTGGAITIQVSVQTTAPNSVVNTATVTTTTINNDPGDDSSTTTTVVLQPNVAITKTGSTRVTAGENVSYTLSYTNNGTAKADGVSVVDTLPAGVTFVSANPAPASQSGQTATWTIGTLAPGASGSIAVMVTSSATLGNGANLRNVATITTTSTGDTPGDNTDDHNTTVERADVYVTKSSGTTFPVVSGQQVSYTIDYGNMGPATARSVTLSDVMPTQLSNVSWTCTAGCSGSGTGAISLSLGDLPAGATGRITVTGTARTTLAREDFANTASIRTPTPETRTDNNDSTVPGAVWTTDLQIIKDATPQVIAGTTFTATLSYRNNGPAPASGVTLTDTLPAGITLISASPAPSAQSGQTLSWNLGVLADGANGAISLTLQSDAALPDGSTVTNQAVVTTTTTDRTTTNNQDDAHTLIRTESDIRVVKTGPADVNVDEQVTFTITYANDGPSVARSVVVSDTLPSTLDFVSATPAPATNSNGIVIWNVGDLAPGAGSTLTVVMQTQPIQPANTIQAFNTVTITTTTTDPDPSDNTDDHTVNVHRPDVAIAKAGPISALGGERILYTLLYDNRGAAPAQNVTVTDTLPAGVTFYSSSPPPSNRNGQGITWNVGNLAIGASGVINVMVEISPTAPSTLTNRATITTPTPGDDPGNNESSTTTTIATLKIGDRVWHDQDEDGLQDSTEPGISGVVVQLINPQTLQVLAEQTTGADGYYLFDGLAPGTYTVQLHPQATVSGPTAGYHVTTNALYTVTLGASNREYLGADVGLNQPSSTQVVLSAFTATPQNGSLLLNWTTTQEQNSDMFIVLRNTGVDRETAVEVARVAARSTTGSTYSVTDADAPVGVYYWLVEREFGGKETVLVAWSQNPMPPPSYQVWLPLVSR